MQPPPQTVEEALAEIRQAREDLEHIVVRRDRAVLAARQGGASLRVIAEAVGCSKDGVTGILRRQQQG